MEHPLLLMAIVEMLAVQYWVYQGMVYGEPAAV